jgi:hypothetical protein
MYELIHEKAQNQNKLPVFSSLTDPTDSSKSINRTTPERDALLFSTQVTQAHTEVVQAN